MTEIGCWKCGERSSIDEGPPFKCSFCKARLRRAEGSWKHTLRMEILSREREGLASLGSADFPALARFLTVTNKELGDFIDIARQEPSTETAPAPTEVAPSIVAISGRPVAENDGQQPYVAIPLNLVPSAEWTDRFMDSVSLPPDRALDFDDNGIILRGPMTDIESVLTLISDAIEDANSPAATAQAELDRWWAQQGAARGPEHSAARQQDAPRIIPATPSDEENGGTAILGWSLGLGIASMFFGTTFGLLPIITVLVSVIAVWKKAGQPRGWMGWVGLVLGATYTLLYLDNYGYFNSLPT